MRCRVTGNCLRKILQRPRQPHQRENSIGGDLCLLELLHQHGYKQHLVHVEDIVKAHTASGGAMPSVAVRPLFKNLRVAPPLRVEAAQVKPFLDLLFGCARLHALRLRRRGVLRYHPSLRSSFTRSANVSFSAFLSASVFAFLYSASMR